MKSVIKGWIARDGEEERKLYFFFDKKPYRGTQYKVWLPDDSDFLAIPDTKHPELTWEDEPKLATLTVETKD